MTSNANHVDTELTPGRDDHFGLCPHCLEAADGRQEHLYYLNVRKSHAFACDKHRVYWWVGENLFSSWQDETEQDWQRNFDKLKTMTKVKPGYLPETKAAAKRRDQRSWQVTHLFESLNESQQDIVLKLLCELAGMDIQPEGYCLRSRVRDEIPWQ